MVSGTNIPQESLIALFNRGETGHRPVFCIHPLWGEVTCYVPLMNALGPDYPLYCVKSQAHTTTIAIPSNLEEMAKSYIKAIREIQVEGPYNLVGWSAGGHFAIEVAYHLTLQGESVNSLVCIDAKIGRNYSEYHSWTGLQLFLMIFEQDLQLNLGIKPEQLATLNDDELEDVENKILVKCQAIKFVSIIWELSDFRRFCNAMAVNLKFLIDFNSKYKNGRFRDFNFNIKHLYLMMIEKQFDHLPDLEGIDLNVTGEVVTKLFAARHLEMGNPPHIQIIADLIKQNL